jgi:hypothetical protein
MGERRREQEHDPDRLEPAGQPVVAAVVEAQLEEARARVFRAYVRARSKARDLAFDDGDDATGRDERRRGS